LRAFAVKFGQFKNSTQCILIFFGYQHRDAFLTLRVGKFADFYSQEGDVLSNNFFTIL
jgi:hypothetical protein